MKNGIVRTFDADKGYGWIVPSDGGNLFVHKSNIPGDITTLPIQRESLIRVAHEPQRWCRGDQRIAEQVTTLHNWGKRGARWGPSLVGRRFYFVAFLRDFLTSPTSPRGPEDTVVTNKETGASSRDPGASGCPSFPALAPHTRPRH